jgi:dTDP-4-amino-4,6-dideoxygalactose transaminase
MVCTIANATLGLQAVLSNIEVEKSSIVEVPSFTFTASPASILSSERELLFIDVDEDLRCIPTTKAELIMDVLPFGAPPRFPQWYKGLKHVLIDGAASFDSLQKIGLNPLFDDNISIVLSLHSTKLVGGGEGGVIISKNTELISRIKKWQNFGLDPINSSTRISSFAGTNAKMSEYACAVALASLDKWPETRAEYLKISDKANRIANEFGVRVHPAMAQGFATPNWLVITESKQKIESVQRAFTRFGFETKKWWGEGCHRMPAYASCKREKLEITERLSGQYLGLPFHLFLDETYWNQVQEIFSGISD